LCCDLTFARRRRAGGADHAYNDQVYHRGKVEEEKRPPRRMTPRPDSSSTKKTTKSKKADTAMSSR